MDVLYVERESSYEEFQKILNHTYSAHIWSHCYNIQAARGAPYCILKEIFINKTGVMQRQTTLYDPTTDRFEQFKKIIYNSLCSETTPEGKSYDAYLCWESLRDSRAIGPQMPRIYAPLPATCIVALPNPLLWNNDGVINYATRLAFTKERLAQLKTLFLLAKEKHTPLIVLPRELICHIIYFIML